MCKKKDVMDQRAKEIFNIVSDRRTEKERKDAIRQKKMQESSEKYCELTFKLLRHMAEIYDLNQDDRLLKIVYRGTSLEDSKLKIETFPEADYIALGIDEHDFFIEGFQAFQDEMRGVTNIIVDIKEFDSYEYGKVVHKDYKVTVKMFV